MPKQTRIQKSGTQFRYNVRSKDLPATQGMLHLVRSELKAELRSGTSQMNAKFDRVEARFNQVDARFSQLESNFNQIDARFNEMESRFSKVDARFNEMESRFSQIDARFNDVDSKLEKVYSEVSRIAVLVEEQNSRNNLVLEGLSGLSREASGGVHQRAATKIISLAPLNPAR